MQFTGRGSYLSSNLNNWEIVLCENYKCELILRENINHPWALKGISLQSSKDFLQRYFFK